MKLKQSPQMIEEIPKSESDGGEVDPESNKEDKIPEENEESSDHKISVPDVEDLDS